MSQGAVEKALGKLVTDDAFRAHFFADPAVASVTAGLVLSRVELDALSHLSKQALARFSRRLDDRIRRLPAEAEQRPPPAGELDAEDDRPLAGSCTRSGTAQSARTPRAGDDMASLDALEKAGSGANPAEDPEDADPAVKMVVHAERRTPMKQAFLIVLAVGLLVGGAQGVALGQSAGAPSVPQGAQGYGLPVPDYPPDAYRVMDTTKSGWMHTSQQTELTVDGKIAAVDLSNKTLTLNDGEQFTLPENLEYSSLPTIGQEVEVTFAEQNGQKVVRWIDLDDTADSHDNS